MAGAIVHCRVVGAQRLSIGRERLGSLPSRQAPLRSAGDAVARDYGPSWLGELRLPGGNILQEEPQGDILRVVGVVV